MKANNIIKDLRIAKGMSQQDLAKVLGIGRTTVCEYENGRIQPPYEKLMIMSKLFNVPVDSIMNIKNISGESDFDVLGQLELICHNLKKDYVITWDNEIMSAEFKELVLAQIQTTIATIKYLNK